jgi:hypothetical protein
VNPGSRATSRASFRQRPRSTIAYVQPRADRTLWRTTQACDLYRPRRARHVTLSRRPDAAFQRLSPCQGSSLSPDRACVSRHTKPVNHHLRFTRSGVKMRRSIPRNPIARCLSDVP